MDDEPINLAYVHMFRGKEKFKEGNNAYERKKTVLDRGTNKQIQEDTELFHTGAMRTSTLKEHNA